MSANKVISFASGKGGVGKTTLVTNLGSLWAKRGAETLLIDGDWNLGKLSITLGVRPQWTVDQVLSGEISLATAIQPICRGLSLLASPSGVVGLEELSESARNQIFFDIGELKDRYDIICFDHSSGLNWGVLQFAAASHQHIIVTTPEPTSYTDAYAIMKILSKRFAIRQFQLLVTMSQNREETEGIISRFCEVVLRHLGVRVTLLEIIAWEPGLLDSLRRQKPFVELQPRAIMTGQLERVCDKLDRAECLSSGRLNFFYDESAPTLFQRDELCQL